MARPGLLVCSDTLIDVRCDSMANSASSHSLWFISWIALQAKASTPDDYSSNEEDTKGKVAHVQGRIRGTLVSFAASYRTLGSRTKYEHGGTGPHSHYHLAT